jgi:hypothetical protein
MRDWYAVLDEQLGETLQTFENENSGISVKMLFRYQI